MVDIPENKSIIKNKKINTQMRTQTPGGPTARANFATPFVGGDALVKTVDNLSKLANSVADEQAVARAKQKGYDEQQKVGSKQFLGKDDATPAFTLTGKALQEGRSVAFINAKKNELDELKLIASKNPNSFATYSEEADNYKTQWLENVPSFMTAQMSDLFEEKNSIYGVQVQGKEIQNQIADNIAKVDERLSKDMNAVYGMFRDPNVSNEDIVARVVEITDHLNIDYPKVQASSSHLRKNQKLVKKILKMNIAEKEWLNASPEKRAEIKKKAAEGILLGGETGEAFSGFFPDGLELTLEERTELVSLIDSLEKNFTTTNQRAINANDNAFATVIKNIEDGRGFEIQSTQDSGDFSIVFRDQEKYDFDDYAEAWLQLGKDQTYIDQKKEEFETAYLIGEAKRKGYMLPTGSAESAEYISTLEANIAEIEKSTDSITKNAYLEIYEKQLIAFKETQDAKSKALADPNINLADYLLDQKVVELKTPDKAGLDQLNYDLSILTNTPLQVSESIPNTIVNTIKNELQKSTGSEQQNGMFRIEQDLGTNHTISALQDIVKTSDNIVDDSKLAIFGIVDANKQEYAFSVGIEYENNLSLLINEDENTVKKVENAIKLEVENVFADGGQLEFVGNSLQKESLKGLFAIVYADKLKRLDNDQALEATIQYIKDTHYIGDLTDNITIIASKRDIPNENVMFEYRKIYNNWLNDPIGHGSRSATSDKIHDLMENIEDAKVYVTNNGIQVVDPISGREMFFQKIPNATGQNVYSENAIQPFYKRETVALQDKDHLGSGLIKYDHNKFEQNFDPLSAPIETFDIEGPTTEQYKKSLDDKAQEAVIDFFAFKDKNLRIEKGPTEEEPFLFFNKQTGEQLTVDEAKNLSAEFDARQNAVNLDVINEMDRPGTIDTFVLGVINHAVVVNQLQPWMLEYMAANIPYAERLKDKFVRQAVLDQIKDNHVSFVNGIPLKGTNGGVHQGISWLTTTIREMDETVLENYRETPPDFGLDEVGGS